VLAGLLCLAFIGFAGTSFAVVRWEVVPSPTEVITIGRSEVVGSITLFVRGTGITGTSTNGNAQIGIIFTNPAMQIDNTITTGIKLIKNGAGLASATVVNVENKDINGRCSGFITINIPFGGTVGDGDFLRVEGIRGRIDLSGPPQGTTPGTDLYASLQSINDPSANLFTPDIVRVAKTLCPYFVSVAKDQLLLCFPTSGKYSGSPAYSITITEGFARAFVDANSNGVTGKARVDSEGANLGAPTNNTQFVIYLNSIPASVASVSWPASVAANSNSATTNPTSSYLVYVDSTAINSTGEATATYKFVSNNQTDLSDITTETFVLSPGLVLSSSNSIATGTVNAAVWLHPFAAETVTGCPQPTPTLNRPRFLKASRSTNSGCVPPDEAPQPYADIIRCNCYLLYTYVSAGTAWDTGMVVANTSGDTAVFGSTAHAPDQQGPISFYYYDRSKGYVGTMSTNTDTLPGTSFVNVLSAMLPTGVTAFEGYVIAKTSFQYCHGFAFIADKSFASLAQGYLANVIPDPTIKGKYRTASAAADITNVPAGESLNN